MSTYVWPQGLTGRLISLLKEGVMGSDAVELIKREFPSVAHKVTYTSMRSIWRHVPKSARTPAEPVTRERMREAPKPKPVTVSEKKTGESRMHARAPVTAKMSFEEVLRQQQKSNEGLDYWRERAYAAEEALGNEQWMLDECARIGEMLRGPDLKVPLPGKLMGPGRRAVVMHYSDTHWGAEISSDEVPGNRYNWDVASRRVSHCVAQMNSFHQEGRDDQIGVVVFNGDLFEGAIHWNSVDRAPFADQQVGTMIYCRDIVTLAAQEFRKVVVMCQYGNHGRSGHRDHGRTMKQKWDGADYIVYKAAEAATAHLPTVRWIIPKTPYSIAELAGHKVLVSHGDTILPAPRRSKTNTERLSSQVMKMKLAAANNSNIRVVMLGHVHDIQSSVLSDGTSLLVNGCMSGLDPYAQSLGEARNDPRQQLFEITERFPVGDYRDVYLGDIL